MTNQTHTIWKNSSFQQDGWHYGDDAQARSGDRVLTLADWQEPTHAGDGRLGLLVQAGDDLSEIEKILPHVALVVVQIDGFADGRGFSSARVIRDRFGFAGEIRARGNFILDQMPLLARCGVDTFDPHLEAVRNGLSRGLWPDMTSYYQHALESEATTTSSEVVDVKRPWLSHSHRVEKEERAAA